MTLRIAGLAFALIAAAATAQAQPRPFKGVGQTFSDFGHNAKDTLSNAGHGAEEKMPGHGDEQGASNAGPRAQPGAHKTVRHGHKHKHHPHY